MDNYPPGVSGAEPEINGFPRWERWAAKVKPGDVCECAGRRATVTAVTDDFLFARLDGRTEAEAWEWENVGPVDDVVCILCDWPVKPADRVVGQASGPRGVILHDDEIAHRSCLDRARAE